MPESAPRTREDPMLRKYKLNLDSILHMFGLTMVCFSYFYFCLTHLIVSHRAGGRGHEKLVN